jgi:UDP-glucuronate 4-epimerase
VTVTGAAGFIGRRLCHDLVAAGHQVGRLDVRNCHGVVRADIRRRLDPTLLAGTDVVIHLAALTGVRRSLTEPQAYRETNTDGTANVIDCARRAGVSRLIFASSSSVYGQCDAPASETASLAPLSPYGESKARAEELATSAAADFEVIIVRPFSVYGPGQRADMLIARLLRGERVELWRFERDFTDIDYVVAGLLRAVEISPTFPVEIVNLGAGRPVSAAQLLRELAVHNVSPQEIRTDIPPGEPVRTWADHERAARLFNPPEPCPLATGLREQALAAAAGTDSAPGPVLG